MAEINKVTKESVVNRIETSDGDDGLLCKAMPTIKLLILLTSRDR